MKASLQLRNQQTIAPALQKSLQLLQLNALEFAQEISDAMDRNPLLEREDDDAGDSGGSEIDVSTDGGLDAMNDQPIDEVSMAMSQSLSDAADSASDATDSWQSSDEGVGMMTGDADRDFPVDEASFGDFANFSGDGRVRRNSVDDEGFSTLDQVADHRSLREHLFEQVGSLHLPELDAALAGLVIDSLDPDGYLRDPPEVLHALALDMLLQSGDESIRGRETRIIALDDIEIAICRVQSLEPVGVAATSIGDCLLRQLRALPAVTPGIELAQTIVSRHLGLLGQGDFRSLASTTGATHEQLSQATQLIRSLDPKPGRLFSTDRIDYAVPEVIVRKIGKRWEARLHPGATPRIRINSAYAGIVSQGGGSAMTEQLTQARWLLRSIEQRANTIEKTAQAIVARQQRFFEHGDIGLQPMRLADIAQDVGIHESTVSRVVNSKYLQSPRGLISLKRFFTSHVETSAGDACSATAVKAMIRQLIDGEGDEPISDHRLAKLLEQRGIRIARRTVTKYRDALGIEAVEMRRHAGHASVAIELQSVPPKRNGRGRAQVGRRSATSAVSLSAAAARAPAMG